MKNNLKKTAFVLMVVIIASTVTSCLAMGGVAAVGMGVTAVEGLAEGFGEIADGISLYNKAYKNDEVDTF